MSSSVMVLAFDAKISSAPKRTMAMRSFLPRAAFCSARRPCWMTAASRKSLRSARSMIFSSTVPSVTKRKTVTGLVWPIRCARSMACRSTWGFQSLS